MGGMERIVFLNRMRGLVRLVEFMTMPSFAKLPVLKKAIGEAKKAAGAKANLRASGGFQRVASDSGPMGFTSSAYQVKGHVQPYAPLPQQPGISISKGENADLGLMERNAAALHESGHATDPLIHKLVPRLRKVQGAIERGQVDGGKWATKANRIQGAILKTEQNANRNAIGFLRSGGASPQEIANYKKQAKSAFRSYQGTQVGMKIGANPDLLEKFNQGSLSLSDVKSIYRQNPHLRTRAFEALLPCLRLVAR